MAIVQTRKHSMPVVLITRPEGQHLTFAEQSRQLGFSTALLPCLEIHHRPGSAHELQQLRDAHDIVLFTSANAVHHAHRILPLPWPNKDTHAIGSATARVLSNMGQEVTVTPKSPFTSEAYMTQLRLRIPESLLIVKGVGGRKLIQTELKSLGVRVAAIDVYERCRPCVDPTVIDSLFVDPPDIICVTSDEILSNLWDLCSAHAHSLMKIPLVVNSQRCAELAIKLGFKADSILLADPAGDTGQLRCLQQWIGAAQ